MNKFSKIRVLGSIVCLSFLAGCDVAKQYIEADRATYEAVAPEYSEYVKNDPNLNDNSKQLRLNTLTTWESRLIAAEQE
jgi:hypothetical protein